MAEKCFCHVEINGEKIAVKDSEARSAMASAQAVAENAMRTVDIVNSVANEAKTLAESANSTANEAKTIAENAAASGSGSNTLYFKYTGTNSLREFNIPKQSTSAYRIYMKVTGAIENAAYFMVCGFGTKYAPTTSWNSSNGFNQICATQYFLIQTGDMSYYPISIRISLRSKDSTDGDGNPIYTQAIQAAGNIINHDGNGVVIGDTVTISIIAIEVDL